MMNDINNALEHIPTYMHDAIVRYINEGIEPGGFLTAVFSNDLMGSIARADHINIAALPAYGSLLMVIPAMCWGSRDVVNAWCELGGINGRRRHAESNQAN